jgi:hypothetical protein
VNFLVALAISMLIAYGLWSLDGALKNYVALGGMAFLAGTLIPCIGLHYETGRNATNFRVTSGLFFVIGLLINSVFAFLDSGQAAYVVISATVFLIFVVTGNAIYGARQ